MEDRRFKFLVFFLLAPRSSTCCIRYFVLASLFRSSTLLRFLLTGLMSAVSGSSSVSHCSPTLSRIDFFGIYPNAPSAA